ncbi:MAG: hypothetical protein KIS67_09960 [Verrucomicrobiae bacterium]|nr:hypothetical protein [Verrucomicrobiae bacterium]
MKAHFTAFALLAGFSACVLGQGEVLLGNNAFSLIRIGDPINGTPIPVGSMSFQLYVGTVGTPEGSLTPLAPIAPTSFSTEGRIFNTVIDVTAQFPAVFHGGLGTFQILAWSSSFATYQEAANGGGLVGKSTLFVTFTSPNTVPPSLPTSLAGLYPGFAVNPVPEPAAWTLLTLGGALLWRFRRQRRRWP